MLFGHTVRIRIDRGFATLCIPQLFNCSGEHPLERPPVVIPKDVGEVTDLHQLVDRLSCLRPPVTDIAKTDEMVTSIIKPGFFEALPQCAVRAVNIPDDKNPAHCLFYS